jgi:hypothetical protein
VEQGHLILGLQQTGIRVVPYGFQKAKSGEKLAEVEKDLLEHRTDGSLCPDKYI